MRLGVGPHGGGSRPRLVSVCRRRHQLRAGWLGRAGGCPRADPARRRPGVPDEETRELIDWLKFGGGNRYGSPTDKSVVRGLLAGYVEHQPLDGEFLLAAMAARVSPRAVRSLAELIHELASR